jgi:hypothetical protein
MQNTFKNRNNHNGHNNHNNNHNGTSSQNSPSKTTEQMWQKQMTAELRRVVVLFIKIDFEPQIWEENDANDNSNSNSYGASANPRNSKTDNNSNRGNGFGSGAGSGGFNSGGFNGKGQSERESDKQILHFFKTAFNIIYQCLAARRGQIRQFISGICKLQRIFFASHSVLSLPHYT